MKRFVTAACLMAAVALQAGAAAYSLNFNNGMTQWTEVYVYLCTGENQNAPWPGEKMTPPELDEIESMQGVSTVWTYSTELDWEPAQVSFSNGAEADTGLMDFENGTTYGRPFEYLLYCMVNLDEGTYIGDWPICPDEESANDYPYGAALVDGCAVWSLDSWKASTNFAVMCQNIAVEGSRWAYGGIELENRKWNTGLIKSADIWSSGMRLPESSDGKPVLFKFDVGTESLYVDYYESTGVQAAGTDEADAPVRYFNLQGVPVEAPAAPGVYIRQQGGRVSKLSL